MGASAAATYARKRDPSRPAQILAEIIKAETGADISADAMVEMFRKRWHSLSAVAHDLHNNLD